VRLRSYSTSFWFLPAFAPPHGWVADPRSVNAPKSAPPYGRIYDRGKPGGSFCGIACGIWYRRSTTGRPEWDHDGTTDTTQKILLLVFVVPVVPSW
jgi:hypothetical protein